MNKMIGNTLLMVAFVPIAVGALLSIAVMFVGAAVLVACRRMPGLKSLLN